MALYLRAAIALAGALDVLVTGIGGCAASVPPPASGGTATDYADGVPRDIYTYPHGWYAGGYAYYVRGSWYYPSAGGWLRLRAEPSELRARREQLARATASAERRATIANAPDAKAP